MFVFRSWIRLLHQIYISRTTDVRAHNRAGGANQIKYAFSCNFFIFWRNLTCNSSKDLSQGDKKRLLHKMAWSMFWHGQYFVAVNGLTLLMLCHSRCFGTFDIIVNRCAFMESRLVVCIILQFEVWWNVCWCKYIKYDLPSCIRAFIIFKFPEEPQKSIMLNQLEVWWNVCWCKYIKYDLPSCIRACIIFKFPEEPQTSIMLKYWRQNR